MQILPMHWPDFWQKQSAAVEVQQGKAIADAAASTTTLQHFIWSALPDPVAVSGGQFLNVHHWKGKSLITEYIHTKKPDLWAKTTTILFPNYFENTLTNPHRHLSIKDSKGTYTLKFPHSPQTVMPHVAIGDTGKLVHLVLEAGPTYFTKTIAFWAQAPSEADKLAEIGSCMIAPPDKACNKASKMKLFPHCETHRIKLPRDILSVVKPRRLYPLLRLGAIAAQSSL
ncbi:NmrA-like family protein [Talaromyces stipitatus ATCC 10500]|uniref:NmrA-like family protein n=1 Tax=Talaromyces stipitatus (strain ATCC 10500 / CBS 375.48 / QM 6759 / NRRL 1006) TaxID=441959 RepID=B8ML78_TALSN|nr:NmrA-like family protein [Talaromyces stipitatus ATCC 10500]EED14993.1 NmrA-like family protein [Talaromyces stipitatus ATCC 10500]